MTREQRLAEFSGAVIELTSAAYRRGYLNRIDDKGHGDRAAEESAAYKRVVELFTREQGAKS